MGNAKHVGRRMSGQSMQNVALQQLIEAAPRITHLRAAIWNSGFQPVAVENPVIGAKETGKRPKPGHGWPDGARRNPPECLAGPPDSAALNTGILCDGLRAIDIDIDDPTLARKIEAIAVARFGATITRTRENSPRLLLVYQAAEGEPAKRVIAGEFGKVEVLGRGQQAVVMGLHHTARWLNWRDNRGPWNTPRDDLPPVSPADEDAFAAEIAPLVGAPAKVVDLAARLAP